MFRIVLQIAIALASITAASLTLSTVYANDWPDWRGPNRDGINPETGLLESWPAEGPTKLWEVSLGEGYSCMTIVDGRLYTMCQDSEGQWAVAFTANSGTEIWKVKSGSKFKKYPGPRSTPVVDGERIYTLDATAHLMCLNAADGSQVWKLDMPKAFKAENLVWGTSMTPLIDGDRLIVNPGLSDGNSIAALNKNDGSTIWTALNDKAGYASPVLATIHGQKQYVFFTGEGAVGISPEGKVLWQHPWKTDPSIHAATPIVQGNRIFIGSGYEEGCTVFEVQAGDPMTTREIWKNKAIRSHFTTPILHDGYLYGFDESVLTCVDFNTGQTAWKQGGFGKGSLVMAGGKLYVLGYGGNLALVEPASTAFTKISEFQTGLSKCWTMPVVANGKLFVRDPGRLIVYDISPAQ